MLNRKAETPRQSTSWRRFASGGVLLAAFVLPSAVHADPGVNGSYSWSETWDTKKSIRKVWSSLLAGYQQARNTAKAMVKQMQLTASLAHSMEEQLIAWQTVAKKTEALLHADVWDESPIGVVENLEENVFQKSDALLYNRIPNARQASENMNAARRAWVKGLVWNETDDAEAAKKTLLGSLGLTALSPDQRKQKTREKVAYDIRSTTLAKTAARQDRMAYMTDDADAHLSAVGSTLTRMDASEAKGLSEMNGQLSENDFVQGQMESRQSMDRLELYAQILLARASDYNRAGLAVHMAMVPMLLLSDELASRRSP
jgi:hypothetical protein